MSVRVAINGFGSIGRRFLRIASERPSIEVVAVNDLYDTATRAHLLKYDSNYGIFDKDVQVLDGSLSIGGKQVKMTFEKDPTALPWKDLGVDIVIESTGKFTEAQKASAHLAAGAKKVIISAPAKGEDLTIVLGVNSDKYSPEHKIISMASCTTNCLAPVAKVINDKFGIKKGLMTTVHAYTNDQVTLDFPHKDLRRARAAALSMIPTSTGAAKAIGLVVPEIKGKLNGFAVRVPTPVVSMVDLVVQLNTNATADDVNKALIAASETHMKGILQCESHELVSVDFKGNPHSSIVDLLSTMAMGEDMVKVIAWYDNEWAYSTRLVDLVEFVAGKGL